MNEEFFSVITRADIIEHAKEKGLYLDPENLTEKQKKDKNLADVSQVLTTEIMAKACRLLIEAKNLASRIERKRIADEL